MRKRPVQPAKMFVDDERAEDTHRLRQQQTRKKRARRKSRGQPFAVRLQPHLRKVLEK